MSDPTRLRPVLHYKLQEEDTGVSTVNDAGSIPSSGTRQNAPAINQTGPTSIITKCYDFDGVNQYVDLADINIDWANGITICSWIYWDIFNNYSMVIDLSEGVNDDTITIFNITTTSQLKFRTYQGASYQDLDASVGDVVINKWFFIVVCNDGSVDGAEIWINGERKNTGTVWLPNNVNRTSNNIGRRSDGYYFEGKQADIRAYNYKLSSEEIRNLYNFGEGTLC